MMCSTHPVPSRLHKGCNTTVGAPESSRCPLRFLHLTLTDDLVILIFFCCTPHIFSSYFSFLLFLFPSCLSFPLLSFAPAHYHIHTSSYGAGDRTMGLCPGQASALSTQVHLQCPKQFYLNDEGLRQWNGSLLHINQFLETGCPKRIIAIFVYWGKCQREPWPSDNSSQPSGQQVTTVGMDGHRTHWRSPSFSESTTAAYAVFIYHIQGIIALGEN